MFATFLLQEIEAGMDLIDLAEGKVVNKRWVVDEKLGEGSCATVYKVHDLKDVRIRAALKVT